MPSRLTRWLWAAKGQAQEAERRPARPQPRRVHIGKNGLWTASPGFPSPTSRFLLLDVLAAEGGAPAVPSGWGGRLGLGGEFDTQTRLAPMSIGGK